MAKQYREVKRKANVGERIRIVDDWGSYGQYDVGEEFMISRVECGDVFTDDRDITCKQNPSGYLATSEYVVLEEIPEATASLADSATESPTQAKPQSYEDIVAQLTVRVANLERKVTHLEQAKASGCSCGKFADTERKLPLASGKVDTGYPSFLSAQEIRDRTIERSKADITRLKRTHYPTERSYYVREVVPRFTPLSLREVDAEFIVTRDKRTIICLLRPLYGNKRVVARGIAKCAPGDVFNTSIGKAIALRRALGLEVPEEYVKVPQPTEVRVGDIVTWDRNFAHYRVLALSRLVLPDNLLGIWCSSGRNYAQWPAEADSFEKAQILDDSREEVAE